jgi:VanZ family protein
MAIVVVTALYWLTMFVGTHLPVAPRPGEIPNSLDKSAHLAAFAGLALLLCTTGAAFGVRSPRLFAIVLGTVALYGVIDELTQSFVKHRQSDLWDWLADMLGAGLGMAVFALGRQVVAGSPSRPADAA